MERETPSCILFSSQMYLRRMNIEQFQIVHVGKQEAVLDANRPRSSGGCKRHHLMCGCAISKLSPSELISMIVDFAYALHGCYMISRPIPRSFI